VQVLAGEQSGAKSSQGEGDFFSETAGEDVGELGYLRGHR